MPIRPLRIACIVALVGCSPSSDTDRLDPTGPTPASDPRALVAGDRFTIHGPDGTILLDTTLSVDSLRAVGGGANLVQDLSPQDSIEAGYLLYVMAFPSFIADSVDQLSLRFSTDTIGASILSRGTSGRYTRLRLDTDDSTSTIIDESDPSAVLIDVRVHGSSIGSVVIHPDTIVAPNLRFPGALLRAVWSCNAEIANAVAANGALVAALLAPPPANAVGGIIASGYLVGAIWSLVQSGCWDEFLQYLDSIAVPPERVTRGCYGNGLRTAAPISSSAIRRRPILSGLCS